MSFNPTALTLSTVKKFIDRLEKVQKERGLPVKRSQIQEDVAKMLGFVSYHDLFENVAPAQTTITAPAQAQIVQNVKHIITSASAHQVFESDFLLNQASAMKELSWDNKMDVVRCLVQHWIAVTQNDKDDPFRASHIFGKHLIALGEEITPDQRSEMLKTLSGQQLEAEANTTPTAVYGMVRRPRPIQPFASKVLPLTFNPRSVEEGLDLFALGFEECNKQYPALSLKEKVAFVREVRDYFSQILTGLHNESYVINQISKSFLGHYSVKEEALPEGAELTKEQERKKQEHAELKKRLDEEAKAVCYILAGMDRFAQPETSSAVAEEGEKEEKPSANIKKKPKAKV